MRVLAALLLLVLVLLLLAACGGPPAGFRLSGRLVDAETREPVSRETFYIHAFNDAKHHQVTLGPEDGAAFALEVPEGEVRLRIADKSRKYALYERKMVLEKGTTELEIALEPTHYVRLHGHVVDGETGRRVPRAEHEEVLGGPLLIYLDGSRRRGPIWPGEDGGYSERVPREKVRFRLVNTSEGLVEDVVDLAGFEGEEYVFDLKVK
jgi:hypothetical protein